MFIKKHANGKIYGNLRKHYTKELHGDLRVSVESVCVPHIRAFRGEQTISAKKTTAMKMYMKIMRTS